MYLETALRIAMSEVCEAGDAPRTFVLVDRWAAGTLHVAQVIDDRATLKEVRYSDSARELVESSRIRPVSELTGREVYLGETRFVVIAVTGDVADLVGPSDTRVHVSLDVLGSIGDFADAADTRSAPTEPIEPLPPRPVPPAEIRAGLFVLAMSEGTPHVAEVLEAGPEQIHARWWGEAYA